MKSKKSKDESHKNNFISLNSKTTPAAFFISTTRRLTNNYGVSFFITQNCEEEEKEKNNYIQIEDINNVFSDNSTEMILKLGLMGMSTNSAALLLLTANGKEMGFNLKQNFISNNNRRTLILLPDVLLTFMADLGIKERSASLYVFGGLTKSVAFERCNKFIVNSSNLSSSSPSSSSPSSLSLWCLITAMCINAIDKIAEEVILPPALVSCVLSAQRKKMGFIDSDNDNNTITTTTATTNNIDSNDSTTSSNDDNDEVKKNKKRRGNGEDNNNNNNNSSDNNNNSNRVYSFPQLTLRFFLLSPYAPYASCCEIIRKKTGITNLLNKCGEACDVFLVYVICQRNCPVVNSSGGGGGDNSTLTINKNPEVWGRIRHCNEISPSVPTSLTNLENKDEMFFIAANVADYLRLGAAFSWVYGWQLCYAAQGPPPRSLPWLKLFSAGALLASLSTSL